MDTNVSLQEKITDSLYLVLLCAACTLPWSWYKRLRMRGFSTCRQSGNPLRTMFMSIPFVYVQACWKYSSSRCFSGLGICMQSELFQLLIYSWYFSHAILEFLCCVLCFFPYLIKLIELSDSLHSWVISSSSRIQPLNNGTDVSEDAGIHQSCRMRKARNKFHERHAAQHCTTMVAYQVVVLNIA